MLCIPLQREAPLEDEAPQSPIAGGNETGKFCSHTHTDPAKLLVFVIFSKNKTSSINSWIFIWKGENTKRGSTQKVHIQLTLMACAHLSLAWSLSRGFHWWLGLGMGLALTRSRSGGPSCTPGSTCLCGRDHCPAGSTSQLSDRRDVSVAQVYFWSSHLGTHWEEGRFFGGFALFCKQFFPPSQ